MSRPRTNARRRVALVFGALLISLAALPAGPGSWSGSVPIARAETQTISDGATVQAPDRVRQGEQLKITGRGWTTPDGQASVIAVKLDDGAVTRSTSVTNPATGDAVSDLSVVAAVRASAHGRFSITLALPDEWSAGSRHSVRLITGKLMDDDATRSVAVSFDITADSGTSRPSPSDPAASGSESADSAREAAPPPTDQAAPSQEPEAPHPTSPATRGPAAGGDASPGPRTSASRPPSGTSAPRAATPTPRTSVRAGSGRRVAQEDPAEAAGRRATTTGEASERTACGSDEPAVTLTSPKTVRGVPVVDLGGALTLTGTGFCGSAGGARIAVQLDNGLVARRDPLSHTDRSVWQIIDAAADGTFATVVRVPDQDQTRPEFDDGVHRLHLATGSLRAEDPIRSVPTIEFVVATGNNAGVLPEPTSVPQPVDPGTALVGSNAGSVTAAAVGGSVRVVVPELEPGDWVYPSVFAAGAGRPTRAASWTQLDAHRSILLGADDVSRAAASSIQVSLQARDGTLVGWATLTPESSRPTPATSEAIVSEPSATESGTRSAPSPRPVVVGGGLALTTIAIALLVHSHHRRRRLIRELNGR